MNVVFLLKRIRGKLKGYGGGGADCSSSRMFKESLAAPNKAARLCCNVCVFYGCLWAAGV